MRKDTSYNIKKNMINEPQSGFRKNKNLHDHPFALEDIINRTLIRGNSYARLMGNGYMQLYVTKDFGKALI